MFRMFTKLMDQGGAGGVEAAIAKLRSAPTIEVPRAFTLDNPEKDGPAAIERLRYFAQEQATRGAYTAEVVERIAADLKVVGDSVNEVRDLRARVEKAEEIAKTAQEIARGHMPGDDAAIHQLRGLPMLRQFTREDEIDFGVRMNETHYNLLQQTRDEVMGMIGDGEGYKLLRQFRYLNDVLYTVHRVLTAAMSDDARHEYRQRGGIRTLKHWPAYERIAKLMQRAFDTATSGEGLEWVPTMYSTTYFEDLTHPTGVIAMYPPMNMPRNPWAFPFVLHGTTRDVTIVGESTQVNSTGFTVVTTPTSQAFTVKARKHGRMSAWSREIDQDSIIAVLPIYVKHITLKHRYAMADAMINGQNISGGVGAYDTGRSMTADSDVRDTFSQNTLGGANTGWGLRRSAAACAVEDCGGTLAVESLAAAIGKSKESGMLEDTAFLGGYSTHARCLVLKGTDGSYVYLTREKAGDLATAFRGSIGLLMGRPLVVDGMYPEDLNASGIYDNVTTNKTSLLLLNTTRHQAFLRQGLQLDQSEHYYFKQDLTAIRSTVRFTMSPFQTPSASARLGVALVNIPSYN